MISCPGMDVVLYLSTYRSATITYPMTFPKTKRYVQESAICEVRESGLLVLLDKATSSQTCMKKWMRWRRGAELLCWSTIPCCSNTHMTQMINVDFLVFSSKYLAPKPSNFMAVFHNDWMFEQCFQENDAILWSESFQLIPNIWRMARRDIFVRRSEVGNGCRFAPNL